MMMWNACTVLQQYIINDKRLWDKERMILITYETLSGKRYVKSVLSRHGRIDRKIPGEIKAWAEMPKPYMGKR